MHTLISFLLSSTNRKALDDVEIHGVRIQKDWMVTIPILALHYMPEYWDEPMKYNPERYDRKVHVRGGIKKFVH